MATLNDPLIVQAAQRLKQGARVGRSFEATQVKVIGLDDIRRAAGDTWNEVSARVRTNSMSFLQGSIDDDDIVIPAGDGFVVIYAERPDRDYDREAGVLQDALNAFYFAERETEALRAEVARKQIGSSDMMEIVDAIESPRLAALSDAPASVRDIALLPMWNVRQEAITGYWVVPSIVQGAARRNGYNPAWPETGVHYADDFLELDLAILARAIDAGQHSLASDQRCLIGYSVHATTLRPRRQRNAYLARLREAPEPLRAYLVARVAEVEPGTPIGALSDWVHQIRAVSARVTLELHMREQVLEVLDGVGASGVALGSGAIFDTEQARVRCKRLIQAWQMALRRQGLRLWLENIDDRDLLEFALAEGVDFLSSERIWPTLAMPEGVRPFTRDQFCRIVEAMP